MEPGKRYYRMVTVGARGWKGQDALANSNNPKLCDDQPRSDWPSRAAECHAWYLTNQLRA